MRIPQGPKPRGSQHWLQVSANSYPQKFERALALHELGDIIWKSPLAADDYAEYQDSDFLELLDVKLTQRPLASFWPRRGPVWDGLATASKGTVFLIEAKANVPELRSPPSQASPKSATLIRASLDSAKPSFGASASANWADTYYQYANRLAHLHLLRSENDVDARLVFLYFINASDVDGPSTVEDWHTAIHEAHKALGITHGPLTPFVHDVFIDTARIIDA